MKRFFIIIAILCITQDSWATLSATPVNTAKGNTGSSSLTATSLVLTVTAPTAGNWCTVVLSTSAVGAFSITQTNVSWTGYMVYSSAGAIAGYIYVGRAFGSAGTSVTFARLDGAAFNAAAVYAEWQGIHITLDRRTGTSGNSTTLATGATATIDTATELLIGCMASRGAWTTATTVFSSPVQTGSAAGGTVSIVDQDNTTTNGATLDRAAGMTVQLTTGTGTVNMGTTITSAQWVAHVMTFEENACTPTPTPTATSTATATATATATSTATATATPISTCTSTPTSTPTATATSTATATATSTPTATATSTPTPTPVINNVIYGQ